MHTVWGTWDARGMRYMGCTEYEVHGVHRVQGTWDGWENLKNTTVYDGGGGSTRFLGTT